MSSALEQPASVSSAIGVGFGSRERFTFRGNLRDTRHGWLRLTPAYSVNLVRELLEEHRGTGTRVLEPFCGTGTTLLACAELGIACDAIDINPFLVWLARSKTSRYTSDSIAEARCTVEAMIAAAAAKHREHAWHPPLHRIERWWGRSTLAALGRAFGHARAAFPELSPRAADLVRLAFCRALIDTANVSFGHQSMSFRHGQKRRRPSVAALLELGFDSLLESARAPLARSPRRVLCGDSRSLERVLGPRRYGAVVTSPPYANRMSYIRELRPYMYWLGYLSDGRSAGELDWKAIGGTWGCATSNLTSWRAEVGVRVAFDEFDAVVRRIDARSPVLGAYVRKYFHDLALHVRSLKRVVARGGVVRYVVGNSKFYDAVVPLPEILFAELEANGFGDARVEMLRKRTSKAELFEYLVSARRR